jgi:hypothetical protein
MSAQTLRQFRVEAADVADRTSFLHVIDTVILAVLVGVGWVVGRSWWLLVFGSVIAAKGLVSYALAVRHGYRLGTLTLKSAPASVAPARAQPPRTTQQLIDEDRIADHQTPFGVPFGPNVQAYSEAG